MESGPCDVWGEPSRSSVRRLWAQIPCGGVHRNVSQAIAGRFSLQGFRICVIAEVAIHSVALSLAVLQHTKHA